jgi:hypothetical protein
MYFDRWTDIIAIFRFQSKTADMWRQFYVPYYLLYWITEAAEIARKKGMAKGTAGAAETGSEYEQGAAGTNK